MKIIIAGGSGMIGQALIPSLLADGHQVIVLSRSPQDTYFPANVETVGWDAMTADGWGQRVAEADALINLAGANIGGRPWTNERKRMIRESRQNVGRAIVSAFQQVERRPGVVIQMTGTGYYGIRQGDRKLDENAPVGDDYLSGVSVDWENAVKPVEEMGSRLVIMRTAPVLSREGGMIKPFKLQHTLFAGGPVGSGKQWLPWIHIEDLVRAVSFFLERSDAEGIFNVASPNPVTNAEFGRTFGKVVHRPYWIPTPAFALKAVLGEMSVIVLEGHRVIPARLQQMGFEFKFADLQKALENLLK